MPSSFAHNPPARGFPHRSRVPVCQCLLVGHGVCKHCLILPSPLCAHARGQDSLNHKPTSQVPRAPSAPSSRPPTGEGAVLFCCLEEQPLHPPSLPPPTPGIAANPPTRSEHSTILPSEQRRKNAQWAVVLNGGGRAATAEALLASWPRQQRPCSWARGKLRNGRALVLDAAGRAWSSVCVYLPL